MPMTNRNTAVTAICKTSSLMRSDVPRLPARPRVMLTRRAGRPELPAATPAGRVAACAADLAAVADGLAIPAADPAVPVAGLAVSPARAVVMFRRDLCLTLARAAAAPHHAAQIRRASPAARSGLPDGRGARRLALAVAGCSQPRAACGSAAGRAGQACAAGS